MKSISKPSQISSLLISKPSPLPNHNLSQGGFWDLRNLSQIWEELTEISWQWRQYKLPLYLFLAISFNLVVAPLVYGATGEQISRSQAWALGLLGLVTLALSIYLLFVMFIPEKF